MKESHACHICKRTVRLTHDTLLYTVQTNSGECVLYNPNPNPKPQAGIKQKNTKKEKKIFTLNKKTSKWEWEVRCDFRNVVSSSASFHQDDGESKKFALNIWIS